jgi:hypothetical protein
MAGGGGGIGDALSGIGSSIGDTFNGSGGGLLSGTGSGVTNFSAAPPSGPGLLSTIGNSTYTPSIGTDAVMNAPVDGSMITTPGGLLGGNAVNLMPEWAKGLQAAAPLMKGLGKELQGPQQQQQQQASQSRVGSAPGMQINPNAWAEAFGPAPNNKDAIQQAQALQQLALNWARR